MRAAVVTAIGSVEVTDVADPVGPTRREVVVDVAACGICGTDLHILAGEFAPRLPITPGHEFSGTIVAVGSDVHELAVGDRVCADPSLHCNECRYCRMGRGNLCDNFAAIGVTAPGAAAEFVTVPAANCVRLPEGFRLEDAALVEPLSCAIHGYDVLQMELAADVLIYGAGTMGLMLIELAKRAGAATLQVVDVNIDRLATATSLGVDATATSAEELTAPRGWNVVIDATGNAGAIDDAIGRVAKGGTYLQFGVADYATQATFSPYRIYNQEITITGSMAVLHSYERAAALLFAGVLDPDLFISDRLPLAQFPDALQQVARGEGRKVQVLP